MKRISSIFLGSLAALASLLVTVVAAAQGSQPSGSSHGEPGTINHSANVRRGPGPRFGSVTYLQNGTHVFVIERRDGWVRIEDQNSRGGWIYEPYFVPDEAASVGITPATSVSSQNQRPNPVQQTTNAASPAALAAVQPLGRSTVPNSPVQPINGMANPSKASNASAPAGKSATDSTVAANHRTPQQPDALAGTKADALSNTQPTPAATLGDSFKMILYLFPILAIIVMAVRGLKSIQERGGRLPRLPAVKTGLLGSLNLVNARKSGGSNLRVIESIPIGTAALHLIEARGRLLLIGATGTSLTKLTEYDAEDAEPDDAFRTLLSNASEEIGGDDTLAFELDRSARLRMTVGAIEDEIRKAREAIVSTPRERTWKGSGE